MLLLYILVQLINHMVFPNYILANVVDNEMERGWREMSPTCPRCGSSNTKFCYYNNYSLTQPRYFCKGCRRYWTKGGSLRNVPVGGGCRKSRRSRSSTLRLTTSSNHHHHGITSRNMAMHGNHHHHQHYHHHHDHDHGNMINNSMGDSSTSSEVPTIDLAIVYSNFLNQKPQTNNDIPPLQVDLSSIPDATTIAPTYVDSNNNNHDNDNPLSFSQPKPIMPELIMNINHDHHHRHHHHDQVLYVTDEFTRPVSIHDHHHHEDVSSIQHDELIGLPPLPGGESFMSNDHHHHHQPLPWAVSDLDHHDHHQQHHDNDDVSANNNLQVPSDSQFSNMFNGGNWSPLDLPSFETSSFPSKP